MRLLSAIAITLSLFSTDLLAGEANVPYVAKENVGGALLVPGKPAGVKKAQLVSNKVLWVAGLGAVAAGVIILATQGSSQTTTTSTTATQ